MWTGSNSGMFSKEVECWDCNKMSFYALILEIVLFKKLISLFFYKSSFQRNLGNKI